MKPKQLVLASQSQRRAELLTQLGFTFTQSPAHIDETPVPNETPVACVQRLAVAKANAVYQGLPKDKAQQMVILGSDTVGDCAGIILGKPKDYRDFCAVMGRLSNASHLIHTAVAVQTQQRVEVVCVTTKVEFAVLSPQQIRWYWRSGEPQDKAGGYAIQGLGGQFVKRITGSYSAVVGLPLHETMTLLAEVGIEPY